MADAMRRRANAAFAALLLAMAACGTTDALPVPVSGQDTSHDADAADGSAAASDTVGPAEETSRDAEDEGPLEPRPPRAAPALPTPARSDRTARLFCGLDNGQLVQGALRGAACLGLSTAAALDDLARGPFFGEVLLSGYERATYGACEFLRCLNDATDCEAAERCALEHRGDPCEYVRDVSRCDGGTLQNCLFDGVSYRWFATTGCERVGAECLQTSCAVGESCELRATCVGPEMTEACPYYGACEGDSLVRCLPAQAAPFSALRVTVPCGEVAEGATCIETPVGGELPGPTCAVPEPDCVNAFPNTSCADDTNLTLCLFGRRVTVDCVAYGYTRCNASESGFNSRCMP